MLLCNRKAMSIDSDIIRSMKVVQKVGYAPNPGIRRRNQCPYKLPGPGNSRESKNSVPDSPIGRGRLYERCSCLHASAPPSSVSSIPNHWPSVGGT